MSALAKYLIKKGHIVKGCDIKEYCFTEEGINNIDDINDFIIDGQIVIISTAYKNMYEKYKDENKCYYYHEYIGILHEKTNIAVCGTHGKTTTTKLISHINKDINYIIGDGTSGVGKKDIFLFEACEYQRNFLSYNPSILVITNIEEDHLDYFKDIDDIISAFQELVDKSLIVIANGDNSNCRKLKGNIIYFGFNENNNIIIKKKEKKIFIKQYNEYFNNPFYGDYMIYNLAVSIIVSKLIGNKNINYLDFEFPRRRRNITNYKDKIIIDDYAHHPTEIKVTVDSIKEEFPNKKISVIFQPHTYDRLVKLFDKFVEVLSNIDNLYIDEIFSSAREKNKESINFLLEKLPKAKKLENPIKSDVYVFLGAGDVYKKIDKYVL